MKRHQGFTLVEALVSLVILTFGLLGLAKVYLHTVPMLQQNKEVSQATAAAWSYWDLEQLNTSAPVAFQAKSASSAPTYLQSWMTQYATVLPGLQVNLVTGNDSLGKACSVTSCGLTLTLSWTDYGAHRAQTYYFQKGY
jgi:Tfp pilus assembly protein PilV